MFSCVHAQPAIRRARSEDIPALAGALARAFFDDPVASWAWKPDDLRLAALERFQATRIRQLIGHEEVWCSEDLACAALWAPPGHWHATLRETARIARSRAPRPGGDGCDRARVSGWFARPPG